MRRIIQLIIFVFLFYIGFQIIRFLFNTFPSSMTLGQQSMLQLFLLFVTGVACLVATKLMSRYITK